MLLQLIAWKKKQVMFSFYDSTKDFLVNAVIFQQNGRHVTYVCLTAKENVKAFFFILRLWVADRGQLIITRSLLTNLNFRAKYSFLIFFQNIWIFKLKIAGSFVDFWRENLILTNLKICWKIDSLSDFLMKMYCDVINWQNISLTCLYFITFQHQNGSLVDALTLWKKNVDKRFEGVEECYICFFILHGSTYQMPKVACPTCKKKFHSACLYKWFSTSQNSTCPLCRNLF